MMCEVSGWREQRSQTVKKMARQGGRNNFHIWKTFKNKDGNTKHYHYTQSQKDCPSDLSYDPRGKKVGEVMKEIEKAL